MANKDGIVSIGFDYKKELDEVCATIEKELNNLGGDINLSDGIKKQMAEVKKMIADMKKDIGSSFDKITETKLDTKTFESFKKDANKRIREISKEVTTLKEQFLTLDGSANVNGIVQQFANLKKHVEDSNASISEFINKSEKLGKSVIISPNLNTDTLKNDVIEIRKLLTDLNKEDLDFGYANKSTKELTNDLEGLVDKYYRITDLIDEMKTSMNGMGTTTQEYKNQQVQLSKLSLELVKCSAQMDDLFGAKNAEKINVDKIISIDELDDIFAHVKDISSKIKLEAKNIVESIELSNTTVKNVSNNATSDLSNKSNIEVHISTKQSTINKQLDEMIDNLQQRAANKPIIAPVKLRVDSEYEKTTKDVSASALTENQINEARKDVESVVPGLEKAFNNSMRIATNKAVENAKESIKAVREFFETNPITVHLTIPEDERLKIGKSILSEDGKTTVDISGQVDKARKSVKGLSEDLEKSQLLIKENAQNAKNLSLEKLVNSLSETMTQFSELKGIISSIQNMENTIARASGISSTNELVEQWSVVEKAIINATKLDGDFRKNANIGKIVSEYQKYIDMGGTNTLYGIDKIKDNETTINSILSKMKELKSQDVENDSIQKLSVDLDGVIAKFDELISTVKTATNALYKIIKQGNVSDLDKQWSSISNKFKSIADESGKINLSKQKTDIKELIDMYQKYENAGGTNSLMSLTDNVETLRKLDKEYQKLNQTQSVDNSSTIEKESESFKSVEKSVDSLTTAIGDTKVQAINVEATAMEDAAEREIMAIRSILDNLDLVVSRLKDIKGIKLPKIEVKNVDVVEKAVESLENTGNKSNISSENITNQIVENEKKKQEAYKATDDAVMYHAGVISKLNKAETNGRFYGSNRGTGYFGTGHYFVDGATKHELDNNSSYSKLPYTSIDISQYDNLFKATTDEIAGKLHSFLENLTKFTQGSDRYDVSELFSQFQKVFGETTMDMQEFDAKLEHLKTYMQNSSMDDRGDSVSTQFMKSLGYGGVDTRGTKYADTRYGTVIYDLKEESILQANITDELQKQGQMLEKINYEKGQVFDQSEDSRIQGLIDEQIKAKEIQSEFEKLYDATQLREYESELDSIDDKISENKKIIDNCRSSIETADEDARRFAKDFADMFDEEMISDDEIKENANRSRQEYQERIDELEQENQLLLVRKSEIEANIESEAELVKTARERAKAIVEERNKPIKDVFQGDKIDQATTSAKELDKILEQVDIPTDSFDDVLSKLDLTESKLKEIVKITKQSVSDSEGKFNDSYTLKDKRGSTEIYGLSSNTEKGQLLRSNIVEYDAKEIEKANKQILKSEQELQSQKDAFHKKNLTAIDLEIQKREEESKKVSSALKTQMEERQKQLSSMESSLKSYQDKAFNLSIKPDDAHRFPEYQAQLDSINKAIQDYETHINSLQNKGVIDPSDIDEANRLKSIIEESLKNTKKFSSGDKGFTNIGADKVLEKINSILEQNSRMSKTAKDQIKAYYNEIYSGNPTRPLNEILDSVYKIVQQEREAGRAGKSWLEVFKDKKIYSFIGQAASMFSFYDLVNVGREGFETIKEYDKALTEMNKVSNESIEILKEFQQESFEVADSIGATASAIQNSTADWMKLGYSLKDSAELSEWANIYANVGDMEIDEATEHMVSSVKAWSSEFANDIEASEAIVDRYNHIGNSYAITSADIGEAMETSAAALKAGGNSLNESLGLIVSGNLIQQDASTTASALKILSLRVRGAKADLEEMGETTEGLADSSSKMREEIQALTGVDIMLDEDTFKSTAQIIKEIGAVWDSMSDVSQAATLEKIAGIIFCLKFVETHIYRTHLTALIA